MRQDDGADTSVTFSVRQDITFATEVRDPSHPESCVFPYSGTEAYTGSLNGSGVLAGSAAIQGQCAGGSHQTQFTGSVEGYGAGTLVMSWADHGTPGAAFVGTWHIVKGLGTSGLAGITGEGTLIGHDTPDYGGILVGVIRRDD